MSRAYDRELGEWVAEVSARIRRRNRQPSEDGMAKYRKTKGRAKK